MAARGLRDSYRGGGRGGYPGGERRGMATQEGVRREMGAQEGREGWLLEEEWLVEEGVCPGKI